MSRLPALRDPSGRLTMRALARRWSRSPGWPFLVVFGALLVATVRMAARNVWLPGQDFHYHVMSAAIATQGWTTHEFPSSLYHRVNPFDANTLLYMLVAPFELVASPVRAMSLGALLVYFVGFPLACVGALRLLRRPAWGALLAFPCSYVKSLFGYGYMPFVSAAPLYVLGLAAMYRVLEPRPAERRPLVLTAGIFALTFLAHAHIYGWLMLICATATVLAIVRRLVPDLGFEPVLAAREAGRTAARALGVALPSLAIAVAWTLRMRSTQSGSFVTRMHNSEEMIDALRPLLTQTKGPEEWVFLAALFVVVLVALLFAQRAPGLPLPEIALVAAVASYLILPWSVNEQALAPRQLDLALWTVPLVVYPASIRGARVRHAAVVVTFALFAVLRLRHVDTKLHAFQKEMAGLFDLTRSCPPAPNELAYVTFDPGSAHMAADAMHQAHESYAALCRIDTPVYDTSQPKYAAAPLRYAVPLPAPITIRVRPRAWYADAWMWHHYEYVLVYKWRGSESERAAASQRATRIDASGDWELWRRNDPGT